MRYICLYILLLAAPLAAFSINKTKNTNTLKDTYLSADHVSYNDEEGYAQAKGNVVIVSGNYVVRADNIIYDIKNDEIYANGFVSINDGSEKITVGESALFKDKFKKGIIEQFIVYLGDNTIIAAKLAERIDAKRGKLTNARYTPCSVCENNNPLWQISAKDTLLDLDKEKVTYHNAFFEVYGVPLAFTPYFAHPTPNAKAQSGLLIPVVRNNLFGIPLYYRPKPNLDLTFTPRIPFFKINKSDAAQSKDIIYEMEIRHLMSHGHYRVQSSFINAKPKKDKSRGQYYIFANGDLAFKEYNFNAGINRASNKSYLKNYYQIHQPYLKSNLSLNKADESNFFVAEAMHFQGMRKDDKEKTDPLILPSVHVRQITNLGDEKTYLTLENKSLGYIEDSGRKVGRAAFQLSLTHLHTTEGGHLLKTEAYNRGDFYYSKMPASNDLDKKIYNPDYLRTIGRNTPELRFGWQYPLIKMHKEGSSFLIEPQTLLTFGTGDFAKNRKYANVDVGIYYLSEENLFISNRYSGVDYHEYGQRLSYGLNSTFDMIQGYMLQGFVGKLKYLSRHSHHYGADIVGRISFDCDGKFRPYYNFKRKSEKFNFYQDDIGIGYNYKDLIDGNLGMINIKSVGYFEYTKQQWLFRPKVRQIYLSLNYKINESWSVGFDTRANLLGKNKTSPIYRNMRVTYEGDCVNITTRFGYDYTSDIKRGIQKTHTNSISIGLKTLM